MGTLLRFFGPRAFKAVASAVTAGGGTFMAACDVESAVTQVATSGAAALVGYLFTYWVPNKS